MNFFGFLKSRRKKMVLFFLTGFFVGGLFFYLCRTAASDSLSAMVENLSLWEEEQQTFLSAFLFLVWERGKTLAVLWLAGYTKAYKVYIRLFIAYVGMKEGFLFVFFVVSQGIRGIAVWMAAGLPQALLLCPLYFYSFYRICERRREKMLPVMLILVFVFCVSCAMEAKWNLPLFRSVHILVT